MKIIFFTTSGHRRNKNRTIAGTSLIFIIQPASRMYIWQMNKTIRMTFLLIVLTQGLHSIEESLGKLWDVYPPATYLSGLVSNDLKTGFIIINVSLFVVLMLTWLNTFSKSYSVRGLLWFWIVMESINGVGHSIWAIIERSYVPGLATAPILLFLALSLARQLMRSPVNK